MNGGNDMTTTKAMRIGLAGCLLCASGAWGDSAPSSGPMADYQAHCTWGRFSSKAACASLADRLGDVEHPSRDELLALVWSRNELRGAASLSRAEACSATEAIVAEHPDYADALFLLSRCAVMGLRKVGDDDAVALLLRAAESEPDNYLVLKHLTSQWSDIAGTIHPGALAAYRESLYAAAKGRVDWRRAALPEGAVAAEPHLVWTELYDAAQGIYAAALREGDLDAAEALQVRFRRDAGLDELDHTVGAQESLALACRYPPHLGLEEVCIATVEHLAGQASTDGVPLPPAVLEWVERVTEQLRRDACAASTGRSQHRLLILSPGTCDGPEATETTAVARLRAVLEHHGGTWSSEHHRVHAQGFLGGGDRLEGLRHALRADGQNTRARCDLARALASRGDDEEAAALDADPECVDFADFAWGDVHPPRGEPVRP